MNPVIIKFLKSLSKEESKEHFDKKPTEKTIGKPIPSPRSWEIVDNILKMGIKDETILYTMIAGAIGKETATKFCTFRDNYSVYNLASELESTKRIDVSKLDDPQLYEVCDQFVTLVKNNFFNFSAGTIYKNTCEFLMYLLNHRNSFFFYTMSKVDITNEKLLYIFSLYKSQTGIDVEDMILKEVI